MRAQEVIRSEQIYRDLIDPTKLHFIPKDALSDEHEAHRAIRAVFEFEMDEEGTTH